MSRHRSLWLTAPTSFAGLTEQLTLYVRQTAWLYTVPEKAKEPRHKRHASVLPPIEAGHHLLEVLFEVGPTIVVGMGGLAAIPEAELLAWQLNHDEVLTPWEVSTIRALSAAYAGEAMAARDPKQPPPYRAPAPAVMPSEERQRIADAMTRWADNLNGQMSKSGKRRGA